MEILDLCNDMIAQILSFVDIKTLCFCCSTCKRFKEIINSDESIWHDVCIHQFQVQEDTTFIREHSWHRSCIRRFKHGPFFDQLGGVILIFNSYKPTAGGIGVAYLAETTEEKRRETWEKVLVAFNEIQCVLKILPQVDSQLIRVCDSLIKLNNNKTSAPSQQIPFDIALDIAEIAEFAFALDWCKMNQPSLLNELSLLHRYSTNYPGMEGKETVLSDLMFLLARPTPILYHIRNFLQDNISKFGNNKNSLISMISLLANSYFEAILISEGKETTRNNGKQQKQQQQQKQQKRATTINLMPWLLLCGLTFCILVYDMITEDNIHSFGENGTHCKIQFEPIANLLHEHPIAQNPPLFGFIKFHCVHLLSNHPSSKGTPQSIIDAFK